MNARAALSICAVLSSLAPFVACTTNSASPPSATPAIGSDTVPASATATTTVTASASASAKPCFQRVMCKAGAHFDTTLCSCVAGDAGAP